LSTLNPQQLQRIFNTATPARKSTPTAIEYNPADDAELAGMFGRRHDELETFTPRVKNLYHVLNWSTLLGNYPDFADIRLLLTVAKNTRDDKIRSKAISCLKMHLVDCSGDTSLKPEVLETIVSLGYEPYYRRKPTQNGS
jgi:hypothetical protein